MKKFLLLVFILAATFFAGCVKVTEGPGYVDMKLGSHYEFNYKKIDSFTAYAYQVDENTVEKEVSFAVAVGPSYDRRGNVYPVYRVPEGKMIWVSDWSFNSGPVVSDKLTIGGCIGRITKDSRFIYVLMSGVYAGDMKVWSPAKPIRYLPGEWIAVCFHVWGELTDTRARATFRFIEVPADKGPYKIETFNFGAGKKKDKPFQGIKPSDLW